MKDALRELVDLTGSIDEEELCVGKGHGRVTLKLRHLVGPGAAGVKRSGGGPETAVLLLHGGNTSSETFLVPHGGLAVYLQRQGFDVWLLDWRGSPRVLDSILDSRILGGSLDAERRLFTVDTVVDEDIVEGVRAVRARIGPGARLSIVGHCLGGGALSVAIAQGKLEHVGPLHRVVLTTLGLFYEVPWDGWIKGEDFLIERVLASSPECRGIDPHVVKPWPRNMEAAFHRWPAVWLPGTTGASRRCGPGITAEQMLTRLSFMFGVPF
ncbi:MAG TPA: alpha/beta fold hydrolase, partial [Polyangiaceae bacterium]